VNVKFVNGPVESDNNQRLITLNVFIYRRLLPFLKNWKNFGKCVNPIKKEQLSFRTTLSVRFRCYGRQYPSRVNLI